MAINAFDQVALNDALFRVGITPPVIIRDGRSVVPLGYCLIHLSPLSSGLPAVPAYIRADARIRSSAAA
jgi:hypothetical protein